MYRGNLWFNALFTSVPATYFISGLVIVLFSALIVFDNNILYMLSDAYYYSSIGESLYEDSELIAHTEFSKTPIVTTQNGIVFLHWILLSAGLDSAIHRIYFLSTLNLVLFVYSLRLVRSVLSMLPGGRDNPNLLNLLVFSLALNGVLYLTFVQPINDAVFFVLSLLIVRELLKIRDANYFVLILASLLILHFRIQGLFIFFSFFTAGLAVKNWRMLFVSVLLACLSVISVYGVVAVAVSDTSGLASTIGLVVDRFDIVIFIKSLYELCFSTLPELFFTSDVYFSIFGIVFFVYIIFLVLISFNLTKINISTMERFVIFYVLLCLFFVAYFPSQDPRYLVPVFPFILYFFVVNFHFSDRILGFYVTVCAIVLLARVLFPTFVTERFDKDVHINLSADYSVNRKSSLEIIEVLDADFDLVAQTYKGRVSYFLLGKKAKHVRDLDKSSILYVGNPNGLQNFKKHLGAAKIHVKSVTNLQIPFNLRHSRKVDSGSYLFDVVYN